MKKIIIVYWPKGGNVESVAARIREKTGETDSLLLDAASAQLKNLKSFDLLILGASTAGAATWEDASGSNPWNRFFDLLDKTCIREKAVAFFHLGDQVLYPHNFVDGLELFRNEMEKRGAKIIGQWPVEGYEFAASRGAKKGVFFGLALDEDNAHNLTNARIQKWVAALMHELGE
jgi:flavodoxin I